MQEKQPGNLLSASAYYTRSRIDGRGLQDASLGSRYSYYRFHCVVLGYCKGTNTKRKESTLIYIKHFVMDVDGTLLDGRIYIGSQSELMYI